MNKLNLNQTTIASCRKYAKQIAQDVIEDVQLFSTVSVERSVLRLLGIDGTDAFDVPLVNRMVDEVKERGQLSLGISRYLASALKHSRLTLTAFVEKYQKQEMTLTSFPLIDKDEVDHVLKPYYEETFALLENNHQKRLTLKTAYGQKEKDLYVIVATGNIDEDITQAKAAVEAGADIIAVIRTTGQSLLDYVPYGKTTEGFGGTYATQENFKLMRQALDELATKEKRQLKLVNYASGLCMPEIAAIGALERLDMLLNDSMYGIIFRDINMKRTFIDQHFSRLLNAYSGITINTGEDNYLTTSDAILEAHTVTASQFINEAFAKAAHLKEEAMGLGHAFEINPHIENAFLYELAHAQLARECFPRSPLKYMPPTKHISGHIFRAYEQNTLFNVAAKMTQQNIHLLGMMTEAIHTPFVSDRDLAIKNAQMVDQSFASVYEEIEFKPNGFIQTRAQHVLEEAHSLLKQIQHMGLFQALEQGVFADIKRKETQGKGLDGVFKKDKDYVNVILNQLEVVLNDR